MSDVAKTTGARVSKPRVRSGFAAIGMLGAVASFALIVLLHLLEPEFEPSWRLVSEYANGPFGWVMSLAFFAMLLSCASVATLSWNNVRGWPGRLGVILMWVTCAGLLIAIFFAIDPITSRPEDATFAGAMHAIGSLLAVPVLPVAALLVTLTYKAGEPRADRTWLNISANLTWICLVVMIGTIMTLLPAAGGFGPGVPAGWPNRALMAAYSLWLFLMARAERAGVR